MQNVSEAFDVPVKNENSRSTAKVSVFAPHKANKQSNHLKAKSLHIIFITQWIYTRG